MKMTDRWNRIIYRLWAPVYDAIFSRVFRSGRLRAMTLLGPCPEERLLIAGVGTGEDLRLLPPKVKALGLDLSPEMLAKAKLKLPLPGSEALLVRGDAQLPIVQAGSMDAVLLNLILSVAADGRRCLTAALHALKPGGRLVIFDKFLPENARPKTMRRVVGFFSILFGTDINRRLGDLLKGLPCRVILDEPSIGRGLYRVIVLIKTE